MGTQWHGEALVALRRAVSSGDGSIVEVVRGRLTDEVLQVAGEGLLEAAEKQVQGAAELARECAAALRERWWAGDEELAVQLEAALGAGPAPDLKPVPVDLAELAGLLEGDPMRGGGRIDLRTGDCIPDGLELDEDEEEDGDEGVWLPVWPVGSREGYRDMELFIRTVTDPAIADRLEIAITGKGAFRRFKAVLARWPEELDRYDMLTDERQRGRAREWLAEEGYRPVRQRS